jgi:putative SOS response-associated peptidase YedK
MRWGLIPSWTKRDEAPDYYRIFNARADTAPDKPVFARLLARRRCVVLLNGFYEWRSEGNKAAGLVKQPYYLHAEGADDDTPLRAAGLYDKWAGPDDSQPPVYTCTILTTDASAQLRWLHDRMPVFLRSDDEERAWLVRLTTRAPDGVVAGAEACVALLQEGGASPVAVLRAVSRPEAGPALAWHPVSTRLNKGDAEGQS